MTNGLNKIARSYWMLVLFLTLSALTHDAAAATTPDQVKEFIHNVYIEGVPYEQASQMAPEVALPVLQKVLTDPQEAEYWANAAVTIGMIGSDQGVDLLTEFITRREAEPKLTRAQTVAKASAVMSLGYIVNKTGNRKALDFLIKGVDPSTWSRGNLAWIGEFHGSAAERDRHMAAMAILGLGVSGNPEAAKTLRALQAAPTTLKMRALKKSMPNINELASEALKANSAISSKGLQQYYFKIQPQRPSENGKAEMSSKPELEVLKAPVAGEVLKQPQGGEVLRSPQPGEVLSPPKPGEVIRPLQK